MTKTKETPDFVKQDAGQFLYEALASLQSADDVRRFMTDLCTPKERAEFSERLLIARLLAHGGLSYRDISAMTGASTTTIGRVARFLEQEPHHGYRLVLEAQKRG
jgi:TrpR-related protein YerC/YecD